MCNSIVAVAHTSTEAISEEVRSCRPMWKSGFLPKRHHLPSSFSHWRSLKAWGGICECCSSSDRCRCRWSSSICSSQRLTGKIRILRPPAFLSTVEDFAILTSWWISGERKRYFDCVIVGKCTDSRQQCNRNGSQSTSTMTFVASFDHLQLLAQVTSSIKVSKGTRSIYKRSNLRHIEIDIEVELRTYYTISQQNQKMKSCCIVVVEDIHNMQSITVP